MVIGPDAGVGVGDGVAIGPSVVLTVGTSVATDRADDGVVVVGRRAGCDVAGPVALDSADGGRSVGMTSGVSQAASAATSRSMRSQRINMPES